MNRDDRRSEFWFKEWLRGRVSGLVVFLCIAFYGLAGHVTRALIGEGGGKSKFLEAPVSMNFSLETWIQSQTFSRVLAKFGNCRNLEIPALVDGENL